MGWLVRRGDGDGDQIDTDAHTQMLLSPLDTFEPGCPFSGLFIQALHKHAASALECGA
jgi:hypothetical protein